MFATITAMEFADTPDPPYYVAVITVRRTDDTDDYAAAAAQMDELARSQPGFLGMEWVSSGDGRTGTVRPASNAVAAGTPSHS